MFDRLLDKAKDSDVDKNLALKILKGARDPSNATRLFETASRIRDEALGPTILCSAGIGDITPCTLVPNCRYCAIRPKGDFGLPNLAKTAKRMEELGFRQIHLVGGSRLQGYDDEIIAMVKAVQAATGLGIVVNLGCSLSLEAVRTLKDLGILGITSSLETINEDIFRDAKPGDSMEKKKRLLELCEQEGVPIRSMILLGLGESQEDRIRHIFYAKRFSQLSHLFFSRFYPYPDTAYRHHPRCSPWDVAITVAIARLVMPNTNLGLAAGNTTDDIPLWYIAGGGNSIMGAHISRTPVTPGPGEQVIKVAEDVFIVDRMPIVRRYLEGMGRKIMF